MFKASNILCKENDTFDSNSTTTSYPGTTTMEVTTAVPETTTVANETTEICNAGNITAGNNTAGNSTAGNSTTGNCVKNTEEAEKSSSAKCYKKKSIPYTYVPVESIIANAIRIIPHDDMAGHCFDVHLYGCFPGM